MDKEGETWTEEADGDEKEKRRIDQNTERQMRVSGREQGKIRDREIKRESDRKQMRIRDEERNVICKRGR